MGVTQKATVVAKTATKKRGRPVGSTNKATVKPIDWEKLAKQLQAALATEMKANESLQALFDDVQSKVIIVEQVSFGKRLKFLFTGTL
jgi:translation initiation factor 1 (eIF-1/SUI1)